MKTNYFFILSIVLGLVILGCTKASTKDSMENTEIKDIKSMGEDLEFKKMCQEAGYEWMKMKPTKDGKFIKDAEECWGCMVEGIEHVCDKEKLIEYLP